MSACDHLFYDRAHVPDDNLVPPYGGALVQAFVPADERPAVRERLQRLPTLPLSETELHDLELLGSGAYSPLTGFMGRVTYQSVLEQAALPDGLPWGLPVVLSVSADTARGLVFGNDVALARGDQPVGLMRVDEVYPWDPVAEASAVYGQRDAGHPALAGRRAAGRTYLVGGPVALLSARATSWLHPRHQWPLETRSQFARRGWRQVGAIHVCHPWQRVHEYLLRCALEASDGLLLHGAIGGHDGTATVPRAALADASRLLLENYFPGDRLLENPMPRRHFSPHPRAVLQHAILSQNYGCHSLFLPTALDDTAEASPEPSKRLLVQATGRGLAVRPVFLARAFHCEGCGGVATEKSCPHDAAHRLVIPESDLHRRLLEGEHLPTTVTRPDVARLLARSVSVKAAGQVPASNRHHLFPHVAEVSRELRESLAGHRACVLWMTGLSGSGKSTVAHRLERELLLAGHRVFVLDGDTLRHGLNRDLGFSEEARRENLRRAAEVAKVMMDAGLIVIASFISPFRAERRMARALVEASALIEVNCSERKKPPALRVASMIA